jgi:hypothetical protein
MTKTNATLAICSGIAMIILGFTIKQFYAGRGMYGGVSDRKIAKWQGRLLFLTVGIVMLLVGLKFFLIDR